MEEFLMLIEYTKKQMQFLKEVRDFVNSEIIPFADENDRAENLPKQLISKLMDKQYLGGLIPRQYNGVNMDYITLGILNEEMGRGCSSIRSLLTVHGMVSLIISKWGTEKQKEKWLPKLATGEKIASFCLTEPEAGSDAKDIKTTASPHGDTYLINGVKKWITMGQLSDLFLVFAKVDDQPTSFLIEKETPGIRISSITGMLGSRASMLAEIHFENCQIKSENIIGKPGTGLIHIASTGLEYGRYSIACSCVGSAQYCYEMSLKYARERKQFGKTLRNYQLIQKMIAEMATYIDAARSLCLKAGHYKTIGDPKAVAATWKAKYFATIALNKIAGDAVQIHGANGCSSAFSVERHFRDAKINEIVEGTTQMHEMMIAADSFHSIEYPKTLTNVENETEYNSEQK